MINEEFIGGLLKTVLSIPISFLAILTLQFMPGKLISDAVKKDLLDLYHNIDRVIAILERLSNNIDITDVDKKKINKRIKELKKVKEKYPTLYDYKKVATKKATILNLKNRNYLKNQILNYQPRTLNDGELVDLIKKVYKQATRADVREPGQQPQEAHFQPADDRFRNQLNDMLRRHQNDDALCGDDFDEDTTDYDAF